MLTSRALKWVRLSPKLAVVVLLLFAASLLARTPRLGVADNKDFWRVMRPAGISHLEPLRRPGHFVETAFEIKQADFGSLGSSAAALAWAAKHLPWQPLSGEGRMDLRQMGMTNWLMAVAIVLLGFLLCLPAVLLLCMTYVVLDPRYLLFFNSFYADPAMILAVFGVTLWLMHWGGSEVVSQATTRQWTGAFGGLVLLALLGGASKLQYTCLPAVLLCALVVSLARQCKRRHVLVSLLVVLLIAIAVPVHFLLGSGPAFRWANTYHSVFGGLLKVTERPEDVLRELDVPIEHWGLPRRDVFSSNLTSQHPIHEHLAKVSPGKVLLLYLQEPQAVLSAAGRIQSALVGRRSHNRGNYEKTTETPRRAVFQPGWEYSRFRSFVFRRCPLLIWLVLGSCAVWLSWHAWNGAWDGRKTATLFLLLWCPAQLAVAVLGDGFVSLRQHLLGARFGLDLLMLIWGCDVLVRLVHYVFPPTIDGWGGGTSTVGAAAPRRLGAG